MLRLFFRNRDRKKNNTIRNRRVVITRQAADGIITYANMWHPNEGILILRGKSTREIISIDGLIVPPFSTHGPYYSGFPSYDLPFDNSYVGTAHSHPSGANKPSLEDLNNYFGSVSIIIGYPYSDHTIRAFDRSGNDLELEIFDAT
jgi:proteasome lid subunit RPN8/RPN11